MSNQPANETKQELGQQAIIELSDQEELLEVVTGGGCCFSQPRYQFESPSPRPAPLHFPSEEAIRAQTRELEERYPDRHVTLTGTSVDAAGNLRPRFALTLRTPDSTSSPRSSTSSEMSDIAPLFSPR